MPLPPPPVPVGGCSCRGGYLRGLLPDPRIARFSLHPWKVSTLEMDMWKTFGESQFGSRPQLLDFSAPPPLEPERAGLL